VLQYFALYFHPSFALACKDIHIALILKNCIQLQMLGEILVLLISQSFRMKKKNGTNLVTSSEELHSTTHFLLKS
jgi:hypothetical protein